MKGQEEGGAGILLYVVIALAMFLDGLDGTIVNVALPTIASDLGIGTSTASWIVTVYFLVMAGLILVMGKVCDSGAVKMVLVYGFAVFSIGSLACGLSDDVAALLAFRAVQGVGAAMLAASGMLICVTFVPPHKVTLALTVGLMGSSVGAAIGPALGGILTQSMSWHWVFFINVPVGIVAALLAGRVVPSDRGFDRSGFDTVGAAMLFVSLMCGLYALESFPSHGVTVPSIVALLVFAVVFPLFVRHESANPNPVIKVGLFRRMGLVQVVVAFTLMNALYMGALYLLPFLMRIEMGFDTVTSSLHILIPAIATLCLCLFVARMAETRGNRVFAVAGCVVMTAFMVIACLLDGERHVLLVAALVLLGLTWGVAGGPIGSRIIDNVPPEDRGAGSSLLSFFIYFGCAMGTALFSGLFSIGSGSAGTSIDALSPDVFMSGFQFSMLVGVVLAILAVVLSVRVRETDA